MALSGVQIKLLYHNYEYPEASNNAVLESLSIEGFELKKGRFTKENIDYSNNEPRNIKKSM